MFFSITKKIKQITNKHTFKETYSLSKSFSSVSAASVDSSIPIAKKRHANQTENFNSNRFNHFTICYWPPLLQHLHSRQSLRQELLAFCFCGGFRWETAGLRRRHSLLCSRPPSLLPLEFSTLLTNTDTACRASGDESSGSTSMAVNPLELRRTGWLITATAGSWLQLAKLDLGARAASCIRFRSTLAHTHARFIYYDLLSNAKRPPFREFLLSVSIHRSQVLVNLSENIVINLILLLDLIQK